MVIGGLDSSWQFKRNSISGAIVHGCVFGSSRIRIMALNVYILLEVLLNTDTLWVGETRVNTEVECQERLAESMAARNWLILRLYS
jgi:hypothetical protein